MEFFIFNTENGSSQNGVLYNGMPQHVQKAAYSEGPNSIFIANHKIEADGSNMLCGQH